jgi:hypothetical protein
LKKLSSLPEARLILEQLQVYDPAIAWTQAKIQRWLLDPSTINLGETKEILASVVKKHYDKRAKVLKEDHPLGIQLQLETGVANGVLVARTVDQCAELIRRIVTRSLKFRVEQTPTGTRHLRETISDSIYRVMTSDVMLSNAFWNFYLQPSE